MVMSMLAMTATLAISSEAMVGRYVRPCGDDFLNGMGESAITGSMDAPRTVFLSSGARGLFKSRDAGITWEPLTPPHMCVRNAQAFTNPLPAPGQPWCLHGGLIAWQPFWACSRDQGVSFDWNPFAAPLPGWLEDWTVNPRAPEQMIARVLFTGEARERQGFMRTSDGGKTWTHVEVKGPRPDVLHVVGFAADGDIVANVESRRGGPVRIDPAFNKIVPIRGPWNDSAYVTVDTFDPAHWWVDTAHLHGGKYVYYETFDDGVTFRRGKLSWHPDDRVTFTGDGGVAFVGYRKPKGSPAAIVSIVYRQGRKGEWQRTNFPVAGLAPLLGAAGTLFTASLGDVYRLDATQDPAQWRRIDLEANP